MSTPPSRSKKAIRKYLVAGVLVWIPLVITAWVLKLLIDTLDQTLLLLPPRYHSEALFGTHVPGMGLILTFLVVFSTGIVTANFLGKKLLGWWDLILQHIPIVRSIYGGVKQISDTLFSPDGKAFSKAVLIRYPQHETWTVALLTGEPQHEVTDHLGRDYVSVFVPTTPNITAGFFLLVKKTEVTELTMSVDEALKYIISMGVAEPPRAVSHRNGAELKRAGTDPNR
ncbi:MAG: DUF502 domain-containing protein [Betaproteobacteria bacterium]|nr:DUF502 domain-containing protein [Betaproteobacteria bacterium]